MYYISLFVLLLIFCVTFKNANTASNIRWRSLMSQGQYALHDNLDAAVAATPKLSPRSLPKEFDARKKWPQCKKIFDQIRDQGGCGSCWAVAVAAMISQVHCINTAGGVQFSYSSQDILSCAPSPRNNGCDGGYTFAGLEYWIEKGCPSGGEVNSNYGCLPYSSEAYRRRKDVGCARSCSNKNYSVPYDKDKKFGSAFKYERLQNTVSSIQHSIMTYGSVVASFRAYEEFSYYNGSNVYRLQRKGQSYGHAIVLLGWGEQNGVPYWLGQNSWGSRWGARGLFKFLRGENHCSIEEHAIRLSKKEEDKKITKKPHWWEKYFGSQKKEPSPRHYVISGTKRCGTIIYNLFILFILVWPSL